MKEKHYASVDELIAEIAGIPIEELAEPSEDGSRLISVDELRASGALDCPASWRKSLGEQRDGERTLFDALSDDDSPNG